MTTDFASKLQKRGSSYFELDLTKVDSGYFSVYKNIGYTPLQVVEEIQSQLAEKVSMTYVGRLDPMAEGWFDIVFNGDMDLKAELMKKDKIYEIEILFGVFTDTGDILGLVQQYASKHLDQSVVENALQDVIGKHTWKYPRFSSPHIADPEQDKSKDIEIYSIEFGGFKDISSQELRGMIFEKLGKSKMPGDFRLEQIREEWVKLFDMHDVCVQVCSCTVSCSTGTYMRTLAEVVGQMLDTPALAFSIKRI